jgi:photosystem II stability/assembly factor-like uncharacterized protein
MFARIDVLVARGRRVVAAGTDGRSGVVLASRDGGAGFVRLPRPGFLTDAAVAAFAGDTLYVGGYRQVGGPEGRVGALARFAGRMWKTVSIPRSGELKGLAFVSHLHALAISASGPSDTIIETRNGARSWRRDRVVGTPTPLTLERILSVVRRSGIVLSGDCGFGTPPRAFGPWQLMHP